MCNSDTDMAHDEMQKLETRGKEEKMSDTSGELEVELSSKIKTDNQ